MPSISHAKKQKISEQILYYLFIVSPESKFTSDIAREIARDEEFTKKILFELFKKNFLIRIAENSQGRVYLKRSRWRLSAQLYETYKQRQHIKL